MLAHRHHSYLKGQGWLQACRVRGFNEPIHELISQFRGEDLLHGFRVYAQGAGEGRSCAPSGFVLPFMPRSFHRCKIGQVHRDNVFFKPAGSLVDFPTPPCRAAPERPGVYPEVAA